jgi:hypothetical protein
MYSVLAEAEVSRWASIIRVRRHAAALVAAGAGVVL